METINKVHCFFEQSGTFKNEFIKLGIPAEDYFICDFILGKPQPEICPTLFNFE